MAGNEMDPAELLEKALLVQNLDSLGAAPRMSDSELQDKLTIHFQKKLNRGGDVQNVIYPLNSSTDVAIVLFEDGKDRESAVQHEQVFYSHLLKVRRFPPVFTSIQAKIDPFIFSIMPLEAASGFKFTLQKVTGVNVNPNNFGEISCSSKAQLDHVEREVVRQVYPQKVAVFSDCFEVAGASNFSLEPSSHQQTSLEEFGGISKSDELLAEENTDKRDDPVNPTSSSKQTEGPEKFFDAQSDGDEAGVDEGVKSSQDTGVIVDKYKYNYLRVFESQTFQKLSNTYNVKFEVKKGDCPRVDVVASKTKTPAHDVDKAREEFIEFYQKASFDIERKTVDCSTVGHKAIEEATKKTQRIFKTDTLIMKVDNSPECRLFLRRGEVDQVVRHFRDAAGIKSGRKLRTTGSHNENNTKSNAASQGTAFQYAKKNVGNEPTTGLHNSSSTSYNTPSQDTRKSGGDIATYPAKFVTNEGMNILVLEGDITKQEVGAIVNPSTSALVNSGGVAKAIVRAAGPGLGNACDGIMRSRQRQHLQVTQCVTTEGFNIKCLIIHAVGPVYSSRYFSSELYNTFLNCLGEADRHHLSSLAIPLIGSGSLGAQKKMCADALVRALLQFSYASGRPTFVRDVLLVNIDRESTTEILRCLQAAFTAQNNTAFLTSSSTTTSETGFSQPTSGAVGMPGVVSPVQSVTFESKQTTANVWAKPGDSKGQVKKDHSSTGMQPKSHVPPDNYWPTLGESKEQVEKNQKGSAEGNAVDVGAYGNRPAPPDADNPADKSKGSTGAPSGPLDVKPRAQSTGDKKDECPICFDEINDPAALGCKHRFCKTCIERALKNSYRCPVCQSVCSQPKGNQPEGTMRHKVDKYLYLRGYETYGVIIIDYDIPNGTQTADHPNPGKHFTGVTRTAYLPDNQEGREVLGLLRKAFDARLVFTVGRSITSGEENIVTWNDIHHKTCLSGGPHNYGYPDPGYLKRVKDDLAAKGIQ